MNHEEEKIRKEVRIAAESTIRIVNLLDPEIREELQELFHPLADFLGETIENQNILE